MTGGLGILFSALKVIPLGAGIRIGEKENFSFLRHISSFEKEAHLFFVGRKDCRGK